MVLIGISMARPAYRLANYLNPPPTSVIEDAVEEAYINANFKRWVIYHLIIYGGIPAVLVGVPLWGARKLLQRLAALYLRREHMISYEDALKFIQDLPESDEQYQQWLKESQRWKSSVNP